METASNRKAIVIKQLTIEEPAAEAFTQQSVVFDDLYAGNTIVNYKRQRVRNHALRYLSPSSHILELNSGTGEDAFFFAGKGHRVHATDISSGMQSVLRNKAKKAQLGDLITTEQCSFTRLDQLQQKTTYDAIFSNFGGLNCTGQLDKVLASFPELLKPGGTVTMVIIPGFCLWETLLVFKGMFKTAFRRFFSKNGRKAHIEGQYFTCWYYSPAYVIEHSKKYFDVIDLEGLCTIVPPSYIEGFAEKHPVKYKWLKQREDKLSRAWPWKYIGDYFIITLRKK
jgi:ubiquinone/menaquinone biosynthesis C-methylase UbiE